ncbi:hypothetical protein LP420_32760 [Massilia sp. B-10]|nr:hypothetical protein LP420_32760 [Massilia sp. B-10]
MPQQFRTSLSLILTGPREPVLSDDHYVLDHPVLGRNQWFMAPIAPRLGVHPGRAPALPDHFLLSPYGRLG